MIRCLLAECVDQDKARKLLLEQRDSREAMGVKRDADPLYGFCAHIVELGEAVGMYMRTLAIFPRAPRIYLYHAYLAYMEAYGHQLWRLTAISVHYR
ncbi:zinc binding domain%3B DNA primase%2CPhage P4-associated%3B Replicative helicase RepA%2C Phage P4-associated [Yersinia kristensenii]|nr:zinc binding domain%3B DNA primase%2CPhage P4-associated%3B Replicative helicase RepA%2C Phage P4-associated [Yersinia kristensenii]